VSFSAVIVLHDSAAELAVLLASIDAHLAATPPELVVVDTGSSDGGADLARDAGATVLELAGNPGYGAANNAGVAAVSRDVTVLLNPDVELLDGGLERLAGLARGGEALYAPRLLNLDGSIQRSAQPCPGTAAALLPALVHPGALPRALRVGADPWRSDAPRRVGWALGACLAARTATLERLGPFDPHAFLFAEDMDLCLRAAAAGVPTELRPDVVLRHAGEHSTAAAFGGRPHEVLARRRREVIGARLGRRALALDDLAQGLTFVTRAGARELLRRDSATERAQLRALRAARRAAQPPRGANAE
jgi:N-acetylglucosaminyl-diphospho-decaprenol L-rhamnosyltransferase